jgi:hypothetical protein
MAWIRPSHIFGHSNRLDVGNSPIGIIIATEQPSDHLRTRLMIYHALEFTSMMGFGAGSDHCSGLLGLSSCHANPLPGIPYKTISASRLLGDLPDVLNYTAKTRETVSFFASHCVELNSPITQIFIRPSLSKPWVIITDRRE